MSIRIFVLLLGANVLAAAIGLFGWADSQGSPAPKSTAAFEPDRAIQAAVADVAYATTESEQQKHLARLRSLGGERFQKLVPQLVFYVSHADNLREKLVSAFVVEKLRIQDGQIVAALVPHLDAKDERFRKEVRQLIRDLEKGLRDAPHQLEHLSGFIANAARNGTWPDAALVQFIYQRRPDVGLQNMAQVYMDDNIPEWRKITWSQHIVEEAIWRKEHGYTARFEEVRPDAANELRALAEHTQWWVRLYAAEILRGHPEFRTPELLERLKKDEQKLVRQAISAPEKQKPARRRETPGGEVDKIRK